MNCTPSRLYRVFTGFLSGALFVIFFTTLSFGANKKAAQKSNDLWNLRSLGQAILVYANDHNDQLPNAVNIEDYARQLFEAGKISADPSIWQSRFDPATDLNRDASSGVFASKPSSGTSGLFKPSLAVALGKLNLSMPATTPIIWTRGLQPDGTWAKYSPYGTQGGMIVFLDGHVWQYRNLSTDGGQLTRFDGKGKTANILEALPPGSRIGEYEPTNAEKTAWARAIQYREIRETFTPGLLMFLAIWVIFIGLASYKKIKKQRGILKLFIWSAVLTLLLSILAPAI